MKTIQVTYTTKERKWLADISFVAMDFYVLDRLTLANNIYNILCERYGFILDWSISKFYN